MSLDASSERHQTVTICGTTFKGGQGRGLGLLQRHWPRRTRLRFARRRLLVRRARVAADDGVGRTPQRRRQSCTGTYDGTNARLPRGCRFSEGEVTINRLEGVGYRVRARASRRCIPCLPLSASSPSQGLRRCADVAATTKYWPLVRAIPDGGGEYGYMGVQPHRVMFQRPRR